MVTRKHTKACQVFQKNEYFLPPDTHTYTHQSISHITRIRLIIQVFILRGKVNNKDTETTLSYVFLVYFECADVS